MKHSVLYAILSLMLFVVGCAGSSSSSTSVTRPYAGGNPGGPSSGSIEDVCVDSAPGSAEIKQLREEICEQTNHERAKLGLAPLQLESGRTEVAQAHAEDMARNNFFSHTSPRTGSLTNRLKANRIPYSTAGENIARNSVVNSQMIMNQWMTSSGHRANILKSSYGRLGVGIASGRWVQVFTN